MIFSRCFWVVFLLLEGEFMSCGLVDPREGLEVLSIGFATAIISQNILLNLVSWAQLLPL